MRASRSADCMALVAFNNQTQLDTGLSNGLEIGSRPRKNLQAAEDHQNTSMPKNVWFSDFRAMSVLVKRVQYSSRRGTAMRESGNRRTTIGPNSRGLHGIKGASGLRKRYSTDYRRDYGSQVLKCQVSSGRRSQGAKPVAICIQIIFFLCI